MTTQEQSDYLNKHLPYRINSLLATDMITHRRNTNISNEIKEKCYQDSLVLEPVFEISIIFGRALLHFLGIDFDRSISNLKVFQPKPNDVTIQSLFPGRPFCPLNDELVMSTKESLCLIIKIANKSVAHLTTVLSSKEEHQQLAIARQTIYKLLLKYVPEINKVSGQDKVGIWWFEQVENS